MYVPWGSVDQWLLASPSMYSLLNDVGNDIYTFHKINPMKNPGEFHCPCFSAVGYWRGDNNLSDMDMDVEPINFRWGSFFARWVGFLTEETLRVSRTLSAGDGYQMGVECFNGVRHRRARSAS